MKQFVGKAVYQGIALGAIHILKRQQYEIKTETVQDTDAEYKRFVNACEAVYVQRQDLYQTAKDSGNEEGAAILQAQQTMIRDEEFIKSVEEKIRKYYFSAEYAVHLAGKEFAEALNRVEDEYTKARAADIKDITDHLIRCLCERTNEMGVFETPVIVVAEDLTPSETIRMDKSKVLAFVTRRGSINSHVAILAKTMNIPSLVGTDIDFSVLSTGMEAIVDGFSGEFIIEPDEWQKEHVKRELAENRKQTERLLELIGKDTITQSGKEIHLCANAGSMEDVESAIANDAEGIGLLRSEFLYLGKNTQPQEEEQFVVYKQVLEAMKDKPVIIRTLDIGADKKPDYINLEKEENPAMGFRAIRVCLQEPELFKAQLRALYRASVYGNLSIMYPMVISEKEMQLIRTISKEVKEQLTSENIPYKDVREGIMIETPAAAMISDELAQSVDFFSIGTNDLTQYTLAIDRQNGKLDSFYDPHHKAVLRLIQMVTENAHKAGIPVGICGELAADSELTEWFVEIGIDELSVTPASILKLRQTVRGIK